MKNALGATEDGVILSGDGQYQIRVNAHKVITIVADKQSNHHPEETEAMNRALKEISPIKDKVMGFVIDGDNKNIGLLEQEKHSVFRDHNLLILNFNNYINKELMKYILKKIPGIPYCFQNLRKKIKK